MSVPHYEPESERVTSIDALLADDDAMLALSEVTWAHAGTAMPCSAEGGREGLLAALAIHNARKPAPVHREEGKG